MQISSSLLFLFFFFFFYSISIRSSIWSQPWYRLLIAFWWNIQWILFNFILNVKESGVFLQVYQCQPLSAGCRWDCTPQTLSVVSEEPLLAYLHFSSVVGRKELIWLTFTFSLLFPLYLAVPWQWETFLVSERIDRQSFSTWHVNAPSTPVLLHSGCFCIFLIDGIDLFVSNGLWQCSPLGNTLQVSAPVKWTPAFKIYLFNPWDSPSLVPLWGNEPCYSG